VARRIVDRRVLHLIKMWLECPVEETDQRGRTRRTTEARDSRRGIPQGSPLSPLLANLYMRRIVLGWKKLGLEQSLGTRLVTYADDLVILCRRGSAEKALHHLREIMGKLKLTVNEEKTRICRVPDGEFDFLGYTFGRMYSPETGKARPGYRPSKKSIPLGSSPASLPNSRDRNQAARIERLGRRRAALDHSCGAFDPTQQI
jgi:RNA-directed DNA polymerase